VTVQCNAATGQWTGAVGFTCVEAECAKTPSVIEAETTCEEYTNNARYCVATCNPGYINKLWTGAPGDLGTPNDNEVAATITCRGQGPFDVSDRIRCESTSGIGTFVLYGLGLGALTLGTFLILDKSSRLELFLSKIPRPPRPERDAFGMGLMNGESKSDDHHRGRNFSHSGPPRTPQHVQNPVPKLKKASKKKKHSSKGRDKDTSGRAENEYDIRRDANGAHPFEI
jgi:hypothetical protein